MIKIVVYGLYQEFAHKKPSLVDLYLNRGDAEKEMEKLQEDSLIYVGPFYKIKEIEVIEGDSQ